MKVEARNVTMQFNDAGRIIKVFEGLNLAIDSGSTIAVVGESGVGKTTLLHIIGMLEKATDGEVYFDDHCVTDEQWRRGNQLSSFRGKHVGFIFQFHYLLDEFDAVENVSFPLLIQRVQREEARERAEELLTRVGLEHRLYHRPSMLSGGEQQRVAIARALAAKPGVVLADEPTGNLDVKTGASVQQLLLEMQVEEKMTLVVVTHSLELARSMDRVVELTADGIVDR